MGLNRKGKWIALNMITSMLTSFCMAVVFALMTLRPQVVTVDLPALVHEDMAKHDLTTLDEPQLEKKVSEIIAHRKAQVEKYATHRKLIVLPKTLMLSKGIDITEAIQRIGSKK